MNRATRSQAQVSKSEPQQEERQVSEERDQKMTVLSQTTSAFSAPQNAAPRRRSTGGGGGNRKGNPPERRAQHNAIERARRETLNARFLVSFHLFFGSRHDKVFLSFLQWHEV